MVWSPGIAPPMDSPGQGRISLVPNLPGRRRFALYAKLNLRHPGASSMEWQDQGISSDIEDRRGSSGGGFGLGGGMGIGGFILLLIISVVTGRNFFAGSGGQADLQPGPPSGPVADSPAEQRDVHLISFVLDDAQNTWAQIFADHGRQYRKAKLVLYRDMTYSGCGTAQAATGPFYCPEDEKVYVDLSFWQELKQFGGDTGDFAQAYVIAHELGHHVQKLLGDRAADAAAIAAGR